MIVDLNLKGKRVLVVGGGREAVRKVEGLLTQDCEVIVVSDQVSDEISNWAKEGKIQLEEKVVADGSFLINYDSIYLVMATTDDKILNRTIVKSADEMRCYAYTVDDTEYSDFSCPAVVNLHDTVQIAVSTGGKSPLMAKQIRQKALPVLSDIIKKEDALKIQLQGKLRKKVQAKIGTFEKRKEFLQWMLNDDEINNLLNDDLLDDAETLALKSLENQ